ncbi:Protein of unknown function (DUF3046) [Stackebrandtia albiflava]|uniref:DUF3046 family protein n=1 Tax=Stackebrandtia albiflava TaxID=406432 RepID=A0A562VB71_9ACTN|nr:DUF3046 domain-containing protein [Stackebrandtia albiflava]TWJ15114.1 Protein of unknown function (DUF3046) [Stackebrandtia albiflava]
MRLTDFWENMRETFGEEYASSVAQDQVLPELDGRSVNEALRDTDAKEVWMAVCRAYGDRVPARIRR